MQQIINRDGYLRSIVSMQVLLGTLKRRHTQDRSVLIKERKRAAQERGLTEATIANMNITRDNFHYYGGANGFEGAGADPVANMDVANVSSSLGKYHRRDYPGLMYATLQSKYVTSGEFVDAERNAQHGLGGHGVGSNTSMLSASRASGAVAAHRQQELREYNIRFDEESFATWILNRISLRLLLPQQEEVDGRYGAGLQGGYL